MPFVENNKLNKGRKQNQVDLKKDGTRLNI